MKSLTFLVAAGLCSVAFGQLQTGFEAGEGYTGSAGGTIITGVNGWYNPVAGSNDGRVFTYSGNSYGTVVNPNGGSQFLGTNNDWINATAGYGRAQHAVTFSGGKWKMTVDFNGTFLGTPPSTDNLGSVSFQPSATCNYFQTLYHWVDFNNPTTFNADYGVDVSGLGISGGLVVFYSPGPEWQNLSVNHWYRSTTVWDFTTNQVLSVSIQDLTLGGSTTTVNPVGWYLSGGANNVLGQPTPTDVRFFCGGTTDGNVVAYDNLDLAPVQAVVLAPVSFNVGLGQTVSGNNASLAGDDANPLKICKAFVPNQTSPRIRFDATFLSPYLTPASLKLDMKSRMTTGGSFNVRGFLADTSGSGTFTYGAANQVIADSTINLTFANYSSGTIAPGTHVDTDADATADGTIVARVEIQQTGFSAVAVPCSEFEFVNVTVTP